MKKALLCYNPFKGFEVLFFTKKFGYIGIYPWQILRRPLRVRRFRFWISPVRDLNYCTFAIGLGFTKYEKFKARFLRRELGIHPDLSDPDIFKLAQFLEIKILREWDEKSKTKR